MAGGSEPDSTVATEAVAKFEEMIAEINGLIEGAEELAQREEDEAARIQYHCAAPMVRPQFKPERIPQTGRPGQRSREPH
jgi:hypothetical protein